MADAMTDPDEFVSPAERARLLHELASTIADPAAAFSTLMGRIPDAYAKMALPVDEIEAELTGEPRDQFAQLISGVPHLDGLAVTEENIGRLMQGHSDAIEAGTPEPSGDFDPAA